MRHLVAGLVAVAGLSVVPSLTAQTCMGTASFSSGPVQIGAGFAASDGVKGYGASLSAGASDGAFVSGGIMRKEFDALSNSAMDFNASVGYAADLTPTKSVQFCPLAGFAYQTGPNIGSIDISSHAFAIGGSFGGLVHMSPTLDFVPFAGAAYNMSRISASDPTLGSATESQNYFNLGLGAGFVIAHQLTLQPSVAIPVNVDGGKTSFSVGFTYNFGGAKKP